jgi:hypothetical protein
VSADRGPGGIGHRLGAAWRAARTGFRAVADYHDAVTLARWRGGLRRAHRDEEDRFLAVLLLAAYGVDDPAAFETLELTPRLIEDFHRWHQREGLDRFPDAGVCC